MKIRCTDPDLTVHLAKDPFLSEYVSRPVTVSLDLM